MRDGSSAVEEPSPFLDADLTRSHHLRWETGSSHYLECHFGTAFLLTLPRLAALPGEPQIGQSGPTR